MLSIRLHLCKNRSTWSDTEGILSPTVIQAGADQSLSRCAREVRAWLEGRTGGDDPLLVRGYALGEPDDLTKLFILLELAPLSYAGGNSPRTQMGGNVYTSTEYSALASITLHQELSYETEFPELLFFLCGIPATRGGLTPCCGSRELLASLPDEIVTSFDEKGLRYVQRLPANDGLGKSWQATFETRNKEACEQFLRERQLAYVWEDNDTLVIVRSRPAIDRHRGTNEKIWFNQADQWHPSALGNERIRHIIERLGRGQYPHDVSYGDGNPIPPEFIHTISQTSRAIADATPWRTGDLLVLDNQSTLHGRDSYSGPRKLFVGMAADRWMPRSTTIGSNATT